MWQRMIDKTIDYENGRIELGALVAELRALFVEADPHDQTIRSDFEEHWAPIDMEHETRTEPWAPAGAANDAALARSLASFRDWVSTVVLADPSDEHG